jgi:hypothetical protein
VDNIGDGWTVQAQNSYTRVKVTNLTTTSTGFFRLQTALCPIVEAVPRSLDSTGNLKVGIKNIEDHYGFSAECTPFSQLRTTEVFQLIGGIGSGNQVDSNFWSATVANGGTVTETGGEVIIRTNTTTSGSAIINSIRKARYVAGSANQFVSVGHTSYGVAGNIRRWGAFTTTDGVFFELNGTSFKCVTRNSSVDLGTSSGYFEGEIGTDYLLDDGLHRFEIYWTTQKVWFVIDDKLIHSITPSIVPWSSTFHLPIRAENINTGISNDIVLYTRGATTSRLGKAETEPIYRYLSSAAAYVLKYSPGKLHLIFSNDGATGSSITVYDNTSATGTLITTINTAKIASPITIPIDCDFYTGLTVVVTGVVTCTIVYE